jgi:hypothetical protein
MIGTEGNKLGQPLIFETTHFGSGLALEQQAQGAKLIVYQRREQLKSW